MRRAGLLLLLLPACSSQPSSAPVTSTVSAFRASNAEVAALIARARTPARVTAQGIVVGTTSLVSVLHDGGSLALQGPASLGVRMEGAEGPTHVEERAAVVVGKTAQTLVFDRGSAIEVLHRISTRTELAYALELPAGHTLARTEDGAGGTVEVRDAAGVPRVRLTADAAWDRAGRAIPVRLEVKGSRVAIDVPADVAYPIVVDPTWSATTLPTRLRIGHTATLMGNAEVLLAGGGTSTAEVFETISGRFRPVGAMSVARPGHSAALLQDGTVLIVGGTGLSTTEIYDSSTGTFSSGPSLTSISGGTRAVRLVDGKVLVTRANDTSSAKDAELYDPTTKTFSKLTRRTVAELTPVPMANGNVLYAGSGAAEIYRPSSNDFVEITAPAELGGLLSAVPLGNGALLYGATGVGTSTGSSFTFTKGAWTFDGASTFIRRADVASPSLGMHGTGLPSGKALFLGAQAQNYDPSTNAWTVAETLPQDHDGGTTTVLPSGGVLVAGGNSGAATVYLNADAYGPGNWSNVGSMTYGRENGQYTRLLDGRVLAAGGTPTFGSDGRKTAEVWSNSTNTWSSGGALVADRVSHAQVLLPSGKVLIAGGSTSAAEIWDPSTNTSTATASMTVARTGASATMLATGKILVAGGGNSSAEIFDESKGTFTALSSTMTVAHTAHGAVLLPNGKLLIIDGVTSELFDPSTETFTAGPSLSAARDGRTASLLPTGDVVVGGGGLTLPLERYDLATNTFLLSGPMTNVYRGQVAAPTPFGRVVFAMGRDVAGYATRGDTWVFDLLGEGGRGATTGANYAPISRSGSTMIPLARGGVMVLGGNGCLAGCFGDPSVTSAMFELTGPALAARAKITATPTAITPGATVDITGTSFVGNRETSGISSTRVPIFSFVPASGQGSVIATTLSFTNTTAKVRFPAMAYRGKGFVHASVAGVAGPGFLVEIGPAVNGTACKVSADCSSGFCIDGVCCDTKCDGVCVACTKSRKGSGVDGTCGAIPPDKDPKDACALFQGAPCTADAQCATGICTDGVCCDAKCDGQCEACSVEGSVGTCVPVTGAPKGTRARCDAGTDTCSAKQCDGATRASCEGFAPATTKCREASCTSGQETLAATCDGKGACPAAVPKSCEPFACGDTACLTRCTADTECAASYRCVAGKCVTGAYCASDRVLKTPGAADRDCSPYACEGERCKESCGSSLDCVGGFLCSDGQCVAATASAAAATDDGGGCSMGARGGAPAALGLLSVAAALGRIRRRRAG